MPDYWKLLYLSASDAYLDLKKIASILLLSLLVFNWCGYRWVINVMQQKADARLEAMLDKSDYDESQLIEIRVPLNMPYQTDWASFERYDGELEVNGIHYKYVKRKVENGQLVLKCIPNQAKQKLEIAKGDFVKMSSDIQQDNSAKKSGSSHSNNIVKTSLGDYDDLQQLSVQPHASVIASASFNLYQAPALSDLLLNTPAQPPEA